MPRTGRPKKHAPPCPATALRAVLDHAGATSARLAEAPHLHALARDLGVRAAASSRRQPTDTLDTLWTFAESLENRFDGQDRRTRGTVYTPRWITRTLVAGALDDVRCATPRILDPACGSGAFLVTGLEALIERGVDLATAIRSQVRGIDIDPKAVVHARAVLEAALLMCGEDPGPATAAVLCADTLLEDVPTLVGRLYADGRKPDVIAANPPYVKLQSLPRETRTALIAEYPDVTAGNFSLSLLFLDRIVELLAPGGRGALITQNNVFTSLAGVPLRRRLQQRGVLRRVVDFTHRKVFPGVSAYTCLMWVGPEPRATFEFAPIYTTPNRETVEREPRSTLRHDELNPEKWRLAPRVHLNQLHRLESEGTPLGHFAAIRVGFATLKDRVFLVHGTPERPVGTLPDGSTLALEPDACRPATKIAEVHDASELDTKRRPVVFPYVRQQGRWTLRTWDDVAPRWPATARYLHEWGDTLRSRDKGRVPEERWHGWGRTQCMDAAGPKLLTRTFAKAPNFMLDPTDALFCNGYGVWVRPDAKPMTLPALHALLNSRVLHYYLCLTSFHIDGGYPCFQKNFLERFPLPSFDPGEIREIEDGGPAAADAALIRRFSLEESAIETLLSSYARNGTERPPRGHAAA